MVIANRLSDVVSFDSTDVRLAETLAHHTATALKNGRLEQSLEQLRVMEEQLVFQAHHDPLTGLGNRVLFIAALDQLLSEHLGAQGAVLFIDLDDFKTVNDSFGHASGDALLSEVANRLRSTLEADHTIARLGGDEFAVLVPDATERTKVELWARTLLAVFESPVATTTRPLRIRASIGVAMIQPGDEAGSVMRNADTAMYAAKAQGKHRFAFFESAMFEANLSRYNLQLDLQSSISQHQVRAVYQPIVRLDTKQLIGVEALVRWDHPTLGELLPGSFLEVAAECGMLDRLDHAVLEQACEWLAETDRAHPGLVPWVNVNLSPSTLLDPTCVSWVQSTLRRHGLQPNRLGVEVTENLMSADADLAVEALHRLRELGVQLSLDDFGTGYSSLSYLQRLPVGVVKIAKSFVDDVETIPNQRALLEAIVAMGRALDMFIVAEGVEQMQQVRLLESLGCAAGQGFAFSRSLRPAEFVKWALGWENERRRASESAPRVSDDARRTLRPVG
jgi:diguanylate cyclase (GGDEF)-like protein